jgi:hypothetical protein
MIDVESYRQHAADCVRQAQDQDSPDDKNILLNVALAWLRLAQLTQVMDERDTEETESLTTLPAEGDLVS